MARWALIMAGVALVLPDVAPASVTSPLATIASAEAVPTLAAAKRSRKKKKGKPRRPPPKAVPAAPEAPPAPAPGEPAPRPLPQGHRAIAVLPLVGIDVGLDFLHEIEVAVLSEVDETPGLRAITPGDVSADSAVIGVDPSRCDGDPTCYARAARYAGAHLALETRVAALGGTVSLSFRLFDSESAREVSRAAETISDEPSQRATDLHWLAVQTFAPDTYVGSLRVKCTQDGSDVYLDDKLVGTTPIAEPLKALRAGPHILRVSKPGFADLYQFVDVVYNRSSTVEVDLSDTDVLGVLVEAESQVVGSLYVATVEPGVEVRVDGEPQGFTPLEGAIQGIVAGRRRVSFRKEGSEPLVREVEIVAGRRTDLVIARQGNALVAISIALADEGSELPRAQDAASLASATALPDVPLVPREPYRRTWRFYGGAAASGAAVAGALAGGYFAWRVASLSSGASDQVAGLERDGDGAYSCSRLSQADCETRVDELERINREGRDAERLQWLALGAGGALAILGGSLVAWDHVSQEGWPGWLGGSGAVAVAPTPGGAMLSVAGSF